MRALSCRHWYVARLGGQHAALPFFAYALTGPDRGTQALFVAENSVCKQPGQCCDVIRLFVRA